MLTSISTGHNNLSGTLTDELFNINLLEHLRLPNNQLEGSLRGINRLTNLVTLDLGGNKLHGNIPDSIGKIRRLEEIHLNDNMSGELPPTLRSCTNLKSISLRRNGFSGDLSRFNFSMLSNLKTLDLVLNNFTGTIPESIYSCSNLIALRLSLNKFSGQLSEGIISLKSLSFQSNNSLTNITSALQILSSCRNLTTLLIGYNFMGEAMPADVKIDGLIVFRFLP
jgi:Leucine-rich repeat (LRR) protein